MEEIIIDGVNVAGCKYMLNNKIKGKQHCPAKAMPYAKETSCICRKSIDTPYNFCKHNPNCHYKQLKRLEQENAEVKEENERLKKDFSSYEDDIEDWVSDNSILYQYDDRTPDTLEELQACMESTHEQWQNYKQALEEIKSLLEKSIDIKVNSYWHFHYIEKAQDKINEVLNKGAEE